MTDLQKDHPIHIVSECQQSERPVEGFVLFCFNTNIREIATFEL